MPAIAGACLGIIHPLLRPEAGQDGGGISQGLEGAAAEGGGGHVHYAPLVVAGAAGRPERAGALEEVELQPGV